MDTVIDANIFVSALLKDGKTRKLILENENLGFFAPEFLKEELFKHLNEFSKKAKVGKKELEKTMNELFEASGISLIPKEIYSGQMDEAKKISPDANDAPYFALALKLGCPVWSQDSALKKQSKVKVYSTEEIIKLTETPDTD